MELTLKRLLEQAKFTTTRKGYDQDEVDDFLDRAVAMATKVEARLTQALADADKGGTGATAVPAAPGRSNEEIQTEIAAQVEKRVAARVAEIEASAPKAPVVDDTVGAEEAARTLVLAQRTADAAVAEAEAEAEQIRALAREEAEAQRRDAAARLEDERSEARGRLSKEIQALEGARDGLRADVSTLESHVEEQRVQLHSTVAELQRLLEDPAAFRLAPAPQIREIEIPSADDTSEPVQPGSAAPSGDTGPGGSEPTSPEPIDAVDTSGPSAGDETETQTGETGSSAPGLEIDPEASFDLGPPTAPVSAVDLDLDLDLGPDSSEDPISAAFGQSSPIAGDRSTASPAGSTADNDSDDSFLAELRKAMADEEPLGPRDVQSGTSQPGFLDEERRGWRFGKRR